MNLVSASSLPETSAGGHRRRAINIAGLLGWASPALPPGGAAREEDDEEAEEQRDDGGEGGPHGDGVEGVAATVVLVDVVLDDAKQRKVRGHDHERDDERRRRDEGREQGAAEPRAEGEQEGDEREAARDRVQDHDAGQGLRGVSGRGVEAAPVDGAHDCRRIIADVRVRAVVLVRPVIAC
jgi:hypothetical protein